MSFGLTLVLGLFLLAPGFAAFAGLYYGGRLGRVHSPPPPPNSILALAIVTLGALAAHTAAALCLTAQAQVCRTAPCIRVPYDPNIYPALLSWSFGRAPAQAAAVTHVLVLLCGVSVAAFLASRWLAGRFTQIPAVSQALYGWISQIATAASEQEAVLAYVVTDLQEGGSVIGYEGLVANLSVNGDRELTSLLLVSCETFYLRIDRSGVSRRRTQKSVIPQLYLDRSRIRNVAFERVRLSPD